MKAVILAAGKGVRMLPLTEDKPKVLIEISGKPFLWYVLENLRKAGVTELGIVVNHKKEKMEEFLEKYAIPATVIQQLEPRGTGDALKHAKAFCGKEQFLVVSGDNLYSVEDLNLVQRPDDFCYIVGKEVQDWQRYGVLVTERDKETERDTLVRIVEKPKEFVGNLINTGLYKCTAAIWPALDKMGLSPRGEYELTEAISILAQEGKVNVLKSRGYWLDLGSKGDIPKIESFLKQENRR